MRTWEQHQRALGKARAAGDAEAVGEIEQAITAQTQEQSSSGGEQTYDKKRYSDALDRAQAANDMEAQIEIAEDWMTAADGAGKRSPMQYEEDELRDAYHEAGKNGDKRGETLLSVAAVRKGINLEDGGSNFMRSLVRGGGKLVDGVAGIPQAVAQTGDNVVRGGQRLLSGEKSLLDLGGAISDNVATMAQNIPGAEYVGAAAGTLVNAFEGEDVPYEQVVEEERARARAAAERNPMSALSGQVAGAGAVAFRAAQIPQLKLAAGPLLTAGNVGKMAGIGAISEGVAGLADTGDVREAVNRASAGAVLSPAAAIVAKPIIAMGAPSARGISNAIRGRSNVPKGYSSLQKIVQNLTPDELDGMLSQLETLRGTNPALAEILDVAAVQRAGKFIENQPEIARRAQAAAEAAELARPKNAANMVRDGGPTAAAPDVIDARRTAGKSEIAGIKTARDDFTDAATTASRSAQAQELRAGRRDVRDIQNRANQKVEAQTRESRRVVAAQRAATQRDLDNMQAGADDVRAKMQAELRQVADGGNLDAVERATALRDEWATNSMKTMDAVPIEVAAEDVAAIFNNPAVKKVISGAAKNASTTAREQSLINLLDDIDNGKAITLSARDLDNLRQELRAMGDRTGFKYEMNDAADRLVSDATDKNGQYRAFLKMYGDVTDELKAIPTGAKFASGDVALEQAAQDAVPAAKAGIDAGARQQVESVARRSAADAEALARTLADEGGARGARATMGERGDSLVEAARRGTAALDAAADAAKARRAQGVEQTRTTRENTSDSNRATKFETSQQTADRMQLARDRQQALKQSLDDSVKAASRKADARTQATKDRFAAEKRAVTGASNITRSRTSEFEASVANAPDTVRAELPGVARTAIADDLENSFGSSARAVTNLQGPGVQKRVASMLGEDEAARFAEYGRLEGKAGENLDALNPAPNPQASRTGSMLDDTVNALSALGPSGVGFKAQVMTGFLDKLKSYGMSQKAAKGLADALFDPASARAAIETLRKIRKDEDVARFLALQLGIGMQAGE